MATKASGTRDLTQGPIGSTLLFFAIPTFFSNILQSLNGSINAIWVGRFLGAQALAATANANMIMFLMFSLVFGFGMASSVVIAQSHGARDIDAGRRAFGSAIGFCAIMGVVVATAGWIGAPALLRVLATPVEVFDLALVYLRVIFLAMPATLVSVTVMMGLRGVGDSRTPLIFMIVSVVIDLTLNPLLIIGVGPFPAFGIAGSAAATAVAGVVSLAGVVIYIYAKDLSLRLRGPELSYLLPSAAQLRMLLVKGLPMGLQMIVMALSGIVMIGLVNREGLAATAAYGAVQQIWTYIQMPPMAIGAAVSAMAAQNIGAGKWERINSITVAGILYQGVIITAMIAVTLLLHEQLLSLFLSTDKAAISTGWRIQLLGSWSYLMFGGSMILFGVMRGNGVVIAPLVIVSFSLFIVRLGFYHFGYPIWGADALWLSFPSSSFSSLLLGTLLYLEGSWRKVRLLMPVNEEECREAVNADTEPAGRIAPTG
ncbi:MAG TPA: MATE family efflux transporter [Sphingobium sp.]|nr:MATE family efflux transporter [Sphingobium sp.]